MLYRFYSDTKEIVVKGDNEVGAWRVVWNDLTSVDCNRNHPVILVCPFFTLFPDSFPSLVASYHPVDVHCLSIIYSCLFLIDIDGTRRSNFICSCSRYSHVTSLLLQLLHVQASLLNQAFYARVWASCCMICFSIVPRNCCEVSA